MESSTENSAPSAANPALTEAPTVKLLEVPDSTEYVWLDVASTVLDFVNGVSVDSRVLSNSTSKSPVRGVSLVG